MEHEWTGIWITSGNLLSICLLIEAKFTDGRLERGSGGNVGSFAGRTPTISTLRHSILSSGSIFDATNSFLFRRFLFRLEENFLLLYIAVGAA